MIETVDRDRARALFEDDGLRWIVDRLHRRLERGRPLKGRIRLDAPSPAQREAVGRLLGRRPVVSGSVSVDTAELAAVLARAGVAPDLASLVQALRGPVTDLAAAAAAERKRWTELYGRLRTAVDELPLGFALWVDEIEGTGLLRRLSGDVDEAERLAAGALRVLRHLPADGVPLARLAADALDDSHALDDGSPLGTLVLRAVAVTTGTPRGDGDAAERRALWARAGVLMDELSAPAMVLGLRPAGDDLLARTLRDHAGEGEPCRVTLRQLVRHAADWTPLRARPVFVFENPSIIAAAADRLGAACPPLVCTEGQPSGTVQTLLAQLAEAGAELRFHADFDRGGIRIGNLLVSRFGARPWRMGRADYEAAVATADAHAAGVILTGPPDDAVWDPDLAPAMARHRLAVHEERVLDTILADLAS